MASVKLEITTITNHIKTINCRVPGEYKTWTKENQLMELACATTLTDVASGKVFYTRNLISVELLEE